MDPEMSAHEWGQQLCSPGSCWRAEIVPHAHRDLKMEFKKTMRPYFIMAEKHWDVVVNQEQDWSCDHIQECDRLVWG